MPLVHSICEIFQSQKALQNPKNKKLMRLPLLLALCWASMASAATEPNIVFILADDLGIGYVNCYGGDRCLIDTPNIDALAAT